MDRLGGESVFLSLRGLAAYSGLSVRTLRALVHRAAGPLPYYQIANKILVRRSEFDAWMRQFRRGTDTVDRHELNNLVDQVLESLTTQDGRTQNPAHAAKGR